MLIVALGLSLIAPATQQPTQSVRVTTVTVTVEKLEPATRGLVYRTQEGVINSLTVNPDVALYDELREGDLVVVHYIEAIVVKVAPGASLTNPTETTERAKAKVVDSGVKIEQQFTQVVTIDEIDPVARTIVYRGADSRRVFRAVQDPALLSGLRRGDVVEITLTRERALSVERAPR
jgi:hypothetical protein